jgi:hypothetical protein
MPQSIIPQLADIQFIPFTMLGRFHILRVVEAMIVLNVLLGHVVRVGALETTIMGIFLVCGEVGGLLGMVVRVGTVVVGVGLGRWLVVKEWGVGFINGHVLVVLEVG